MRVGSLDERTLGPTVACGYHSEGTAKQSVGRRSLLDGAHIPAWLPLSDEHNPSLADVRRQWLATFPRYRRGPHVALCQLRCSGR